MTLSLVGVGTKITAALYNAIVNYVNPLGLYLVPPTTVAVGSGSFSITTLGRVTFTGASTVTVNGVFTGTYDVYDVVIDVPTTSTSLNLSLQFTNAGTPVTSANYDSQLFSASGAATPGAAQALAATSWGVSNGTTPIHSAVMKIIHPFTSTEKVALLESGDLQNPMTTSAILSKRLLQFRASTSMDGFILTASTGTMTGTIRIEAHNQG